MTITLLEIRSPLGNSLFISPTDPTQGYAIKDISGLDPVKATISTSPIAQADGVQHLSSRRESRNIVIRLGLGDLAYSRSIPSLRQELYHYFTPKAEVELIFHVEEGETRSIFGMVESFTAPLFTREPEATISIMCFKPDFVDPDLYIVQGAVNSSEALEVDYPGTHPTGFELIVGSLENPADVPLSVVSDSILGGLQTFEFNAPRPMYASTRINSEDGEKGVMLQVLNQHYPALYGVSPSSTWIKLHPGLNAVSVTQPGYNVNFTVRYTAKYGGL